MFILFNISKYYMHKSDKIILYIYNILYLTDTVEILLFHK